MDFNLSSICDMLGERIEEYKSTSKKRRIERGSCAPKAKIAKFAHDNQTENSMKKHGTRMYASTPVETLKTDSQQFSTMFSSIVRSSSINKLQPGRTTSLSRNVEVKKLTFDEDDSPTDVETKMEDASVSFSSATKTSLDTLKRRRFQRAKANVKRLVFDEDDQDTEECLPNDFLHNEENMSDKSSFQDSANHEEYKSVECLHKDSASETLTKGLTPLYTPKRYRLPRKSMNARRLTFDDEENEDSSVYYSFTNELSSEKSLGQIESPKETPNRSFKDQYLVESSPNEFIDTTMIPGSEELDFSTIMVLHVGILIRPIREVL